MEHNTNRILWTVLVLAIGVALYVGFHPAANGLLSQTTEKIQTVVGGVNDNTNDKSSSNSSSNHTTVNPNLLTGTSGESSGKSYWIRNYQISGGLQPGTTYTLSGWARVDQTAMDTQQQVCLWVYTSDWSWAAQLNVDVSLTEKYNKLTFTTPSEGQFNPVVGAYLSHPNNDSSKDSISGTGYISKLKLEKGSEATPYTP